MQKEYQDLTDNQWQVIKKLVETPKRTGRKGKVCLKSVVNACLWITRTGSQWRNLAQTYYPKWQTVAYYFYQWQRAGSWQSILDTLVKQERVRQGRNPHPARLAIDSQSIKQCGRFSYQIGVDGNKGIDGRKRHLAVDSLGLPIAIYVGAANEADSVAGLELLPLLKSARLTVICADGAYKGTFVKYASYYGWQVDISQKPPSEQGFVPQKGRWQVERSFAWLNHFRRLNKEYERTTQSAVTFIQLAFINIILARIT